MVGKIFGGLVAVMIATARVWAGKLNIAVVHSVDVVAELYVIEALCPSLKIDHDAFALTASLNLMSTETLQSVLVEGRRRSADEARRFDGLSQAEVCEYGRKVYGKDRTGYLIDR